MELHISHSNPAGRGYLIRFLQVIAAVQKRVIDETTPPELISIPLFSNYLIEVV